MGLKSSFQRRRRLQRILYFGAVPFWDSFAQESFSDTARLNTSLPSFESGSTLKYPSRSNWNLSPAAAPRTLGSTFASPMTSRLLGFRFAFQSWPSGTSSGSAL